VFLLIDVKKTQIQKMDYTQPITELLIQRQTPLAILAMGKPAL
jgi:hypothetical protein